MWSLLAMLWDSSRITELSGRGGGVIADNLINIGRALATSPAR